MLIKNITFVKNATKQEINQFSRICIDGVNNLLIFKMCNPGLLNFF